MDIILVVIRTVMVLALLILVTAPFMILMVAATNPGRKFEKKASITYISALIIMLLCFLYHLYKFYY